MPHGDGAGFAGHCHKKAGMPFGIPAPSTETISRLRRDQQEETRRIHPRRVDVAETPVRSKHVRPHRRPCRQWQRHVRRLQEPVLLPKHPVRPADHKHPAADRPAADGHRRSRRGRRDQCDAPVGRQAVAPNQSRTQRRQICRA